MKRFVHGPLLSYSPYLALALFLMLLLTSLNYFYLSAQNYQLLSANTDQQKDIDNLQVLNNPVNTFSPSFSSSEVRRENRLNRQRKYFHLLCHINYNSLFYTVRMNWEKSHWREKNWRNLPSRGRQFCRTLRRNYPDVLMIRLTWWRKRGTAQGPILTSWWTR